MAKSAKTFLNSEMRLRMNTDQGEYKNKKKSANEREQTLMIFSHLMLRISACPGSD